MPSIIPKPLFAGQAASTARADAGKKLSARGYVCVPVLGRSQIWIRQK
jgi:uncharacterized protein (DUF2147 family)